MPELSRFRLLIGAVLIAFLYLVTTEVRHRWGETLELWDQIRQDTNVPTSMDVLAARKSDISVRKRLLLAQLAKRSGGFEQKGVS